jgi:hypothetical protein
MRRYAAAGVIALLALAFTSLGSAAGSPSTVGTSPNGASRVAVTASGQCSKTEAVGAVRRLGLTDVSATYPVWKVLCGAFAGTGSQTMVASISGPDNVGMLYWAVFQWSGSDWQFLMKQRHAAILAAVGSDIGETWSIYRAGDPRCCPSGGTKTRIWHWNGSSFTASAWKQATAGTPGPSAGGRYKNGYFKTPSGNIQCDYGYGGSARAYVRCGIKSGLKPAPPGRGPKCFQAPWLSLGATGRAELGPSTCPGEDAPDAGPFADVGTVLAHGKTWNGGGLRCTSALTGLTCRNKSGHGFFLSRERWRAF